ncbi:MAG TPA: TolC family protein [Candidatus Udaeobacter sp.]|jgi:outer membrane protein TolC|nr:TolC family protein [Candidatus Udaeobacter sp.]
MKPGFVSFTRPVAVALCATRRAAPNNTSTALPTGKQLQRSPALYIVLILVALFAHPAGAITLENVMQTTIERNPVIQEAKAGLEQAVGQRLVFRSIVWPHVELGVPAGLQYGHRAGENGVKGFGVGRGALDQTLFNVAVPHSLRRGDVGILIAQQQLNVAVVEQLHAARLAFYSALYNRSLESIRKEQQQRLQENVATQKNRFESGLADRSAFGSASIQASELRPQIESAHRAYLNARLQLAQAMAIDPAERTLPEPDGELEFVPMHVNLNSETATALERRADVKLARLFVRAANQDERIIAADYYPQVTGGLRGEWVPVTGIHRQGSTSRTQDFIGSEIRERAAGTWRVIDNGKVGGAVLKARSAREINELTCHKLEADIPRELSRIANYLSATEERERSLAAATAAAEESARVIQENVASGLVSSLEYRITQNGFLETKSGLLEATYQHSLATAEWDRATGRYFQFSYDTAPSR